VLSDLQKGQVVGCGYSLGNKSVRLPEIEILVTLQNSLSVVEGSCIALIPPTCTTTRANSIEPHTSIRPFNNPPYVSFTIVYYLLLFFLLTLGQILAFRVLIDAAGSYRKSDNSECSMVKHLASIQQVIILNASWYEYTELLEVPSLQMYNTSVAR
jgi:hypothetical protein